MAKTTKSLIRERTRGLRVNHSFTRPGSAPTPTLLSTPALSAAVTSIVPACSQTQLGRTGHVAGSPTWSVNGIPKALAHNGEPLFERQLFQSYGDGRRTNLK